MSLTGNDIWSHVGPYLQQHGSGAIACSTLINPEFIHYFAPGLGSIVYCQVTGCCRSVTAVCGDPLADPAVWADLTRMFLSEHSNVWFWYASEAYAQVLSKMGLLVDELGVEPKLQVQNFTYGARTRQLRRDARNARTHGVIVREIKAADLTRELCERLRSATGTAQGWEVSVI